MRVWGRDVHGGRPIAHGGAAGRRVRKHSVVLTKWLSASRTRARGAMHGLVVAAGPRRARTVAEPTQRSRGDVARAWRSGV
jgi:hypothetical protein